MKLIAFLFFWLFSVYYIWNGKDFYNKSEWVGFGKKFVGVLIGIVVFAFILKGLVAVVPGFTNDAAGDLMEEVGMSFIFIFGTKFVILMLCAIFSKIMGFHRNYNAEIIKNSPRLLIKWCRVCLFLQNS